MTCKSLFAVGRKRSEIERSLTSRLSLHSASLRSASLRSALLRSAFLRSALLRSALIVAALMALSDVGRCASPSKSAAPPPGATKKEIELGKKSMEALEKDPRVKLWTADKDPKAKIWLEKLNTMATVLGKVSERPLIKYQVKIIDDKDINAFTLPNGHIYFSRALLETAGSDDEVAAVLAHEIGHTVRMHVIRGEAKTKPLQWVGLAAMLAALGGGQNGANVAQIAPYILTGIANSYSVNYEKEADATSIELLNKTQYNPSALVSFMNRLTTEERRHPEVQLGIYQTHPLSIERSDAAMKQIQSLGLQYTPRAVTGSREAVAVVADDRVRVMWGDFALIEFLPELNATTNARTSSTRSAVENPRAAPKTEVVATKTSDTVSDSKTPAAINADIKNADTKAAPLVVLAPPVVLSPAMNVAKQRAEQTASVLNTLMRDNLRFYEISAQTDANGAFLSARGQIIARATEADTLSQKTTSAALAQAWRNNLQRLFWKEVTGGAF